jgi:hypothetical protein
MIERPVVWLVVPLLATAAYVTALRVGFLAEDFISVGLGQRTGLTLYYFSPGARPDYRPVGDFITHIVGALLWGLDPLPYHVMGLAMHAAASLLLGLWLAEATGRRALGLLAGGLFAVFPLHTEAVSWVAAYYDSMAALFAFAGLWLFTLWWKRAVAGAAGVSTYAFYLLSLFFYACALFTKESVFAFLPVFALAAWLASTRMRRRDVARLALGLAPFATVLVLNVAVRVAHYGNLGGYQGGRTDFPNFFWDSTLAYLLVLLSPVNREVLGEWAGQVAGALFTTALLVGLAAYGRREWRVLLLALAWFGLTLVPVLNLSVNPADLQNNRYLYLPAAAYCIALAVLAHAAVASLRGVRPRAVAIGALGVAGVVLVALSWVHLRPWHTATVQVNDIIAELESAVPPQYASEGTAWHIENTPQKYKGAMVFRRGIGAQRLLYLDDRIQVTEVQDAHAAAAALPTDPHPDAFAMRWALAEAEPRFHLDYATGITRAGPPPTDGERLRLWDFRDCSPGVAAEWRAEGARLDCSPGTGLVINPEGGDPQLVGPELGLAKEGGERFVRLRVAASYPDLRGTESRAIDWFWSDRSGSFGQAGFERAYARQDGQPHVYWSYLPAAGIEGALTGLRLDPIDANTAAEIAWIALDVVR